MPPPPVPPWQPLQPKLKQLVALRHDVLVVILVRVLERALGGGCLYLNRSRTAGAGVVRTWLRGARIYDGDPKYKYGNPPEPQPPPGG